ncbi:response regulator [Hyalangium versicolor]|uniref:response regulator n=1 Tax=Hyalangium versicolor TaxID=2861190 RepID=UPI001CCA6420|nr:response regulator [Hyalangium versicolor]
MSTILLVDDEQEMLDLFTEVLELMDHRVLNARDGREALSIARETSPDLVVTDWNMPRMTGLELCHALHEDEQLRDIPIILHSSAGNPHAPGVQFVPKSCALDEFERLVSRLLSSTHTHRQVASHELEGSRAPPLPHPPVHTTNRARRFDREGEASCCTAH